MMDLRELYQDELEALIQEQFPACRLLRQKLVFHSAIWLEDAVSRVVYQQSENGGISATKSPAHEAMYYIAVCAASEECLPDLGGGLWLFDDANESVYEHYHHEIRKNMAAGELLASMERQLEDLKADADNSSTGAQAPGRWWKKLFRS